MQVAHAALDVARSDGKFVDAHPLQLSTTVAAVPGLNCPAAQEDKKRSVPAVGLSPASFPPWLEVTILFVNLLEVTLR